MQQHALRNARQYLFSAPLGAVETRACVGPGDEGGGGEGGEEDNGEDEGKQGEEDEFHAIDRI